MQRVKIESLRPPNRKCQMPTAKLVIGIGIHLAFVPGIRHFPWPTARPLRGINEYLNREGGNPWSSLLFWLIALAVGTAGLLLAVRLTRVQRRHRAMGHPWRLFHELLGQFPLTRGQRATGPHRPPGQPGPPRQHPANPRGPG